MGNFWGDGMKLIKGGKSLLDSNVVTGNFSLAGNPLFYAQTFYELPVPGLVIEAFGDFHIVDANRLAIGELARSPLKIIGERFTEIFDSTLTMPALIGLAGVPADLRSNGSFNSVNLAPSDADKTFELFGVNTMESKDGRYLIMLFRSRAGASFNGVRDSWNPQPLTDSVTGLPNTLAAERKVDVLCHSLSRRAKDLVVALFSLEGWRKEAADFSDELADDLISSMALRLRPWIEDGVFISRYRSDEFLVFLNGRDDFREVLRSVYEALTDEFVVHGFSFTFSVNAGVYVRDIWDSLLAEDLLAKARKAALRAKLEDGSSFVVYSDKMDQQASSRKEMEEVIDAFRRGEFHLNFQPVVCFSTGRVGFAEGLLRWTHPEKGVQRPFEFLEHIQETSVYDEVGLWVLDLALSTIEGWASREIDIRLCINIGARQLADEVFLERAVSVLSNFEPAVVKRLSVDVIKLGRLSDVGALAQPMKVLGSKGIRFSIDDFGAGDTRLFGAARLPIESIKISQSYVSNLEDDLGSMFIVQNIVEFSSQNGVSIYAKGVETTKQFNLLKALGCEGAQGYAISRPLSEPDFVDYLERFIPDQLAELESRASDEQSSEVFSFALTEHKTLLKEMLTQTIHQKKTLNQQKSGLEAFLEAMSEVEQGIAGSAEKRAQLEMIKRSVRRLIDEMPLEDDGDSARASVDIREVVLMLSELIVAVNEMTD